MHILMKDLAIAVTEKASKAKHKKTTLEESDTSSKVKKNVNFSFDPHFSATVEKIKRVNVEKQTILESYSNDNYSTSRITNKLEKDIHFFKFLQENFVPENKMQEFETALSGLLKNTIEIYEEADITPKVITDILNKPLITEDEIVTIFKDKFNSRIKENYVAPMIDNKLGEIYESQIKQVSKLLIENDSSADLGDIQLYLPFEESVNSYIKEILFPMNTDEKINNYLDTMGAAYKETFNENHELIYNKVNKGSRLLTSLVSPQLFLEMTNNHDINPNKIAGISIVIDKHFTTDEEGNGVGVKTVKVSPIKGEACNEYNLDQEAMRIHNEDPKFRDEVLSAVNSSEEHDKTKDPEDVETFIDDKSSTIENIDDLEKREEEFGIDLDGDNEEGESPEHKAKIDNKKDDKYTEKELESKKILQEKNSRK